MRVLCFECGERLANGVCEHCGDDMCDACLDEDGRCDRCAMLDFEE